MTTKMQDALREFLRDGISPNHLNHYDVAVAGMYFAEGMALLVNALLGTEVVYDDEPIRLQKRPDPTWRVQFTWRGTLNTEAWREQNRADEQISADDAVPSC